MESQNKRLKVDNTQNATTVINEIPQIKSLKLELPLTFDPMLMCFTQNVEKSILIITGINQILTFLLGDLKSSLNSQVNEKIIPLKKNIIEVPSSVIKIVSTQIKTFCLHEDKTLSIFFSYKQVKPVENISGCQDLIKSKDGVILLIKELGQNLRIQYCLDNAEDGENLKMIDCGPGIDNERYSMNCVTVTKQNITFLNEFLGASLNTEIGSILMFSVGCNIFWVNPNSEDPNDHEIRPVKSYSSKVIKFWFEKKFLIFVAVLASGSIEITYKCPITSLIISKRHHLNTNLWCIDHKKYLSYSDGTKLEVIEFVAAHKKEVELKRHSFKVQGIVGQFYIKDLKRMLVVTENRCLYSVNTDFVTSCQVTKENNQLMKIDDLVMIKAKSMKRQFKQLFESYQESQKIVKECESKKKILQTFIDSTSELIKAKLSYLDSLPKNLCDYVYCIDGINLNQNCIYIVLEFQSSLNSSLNLNEIEDTFLQLDYLEFDTNSLMKRKTKIIPLKTLSSKDSIKILIGIPQKHNLHVPEIDATVINLIKSGHDLIMLKSKIEFDPPGFENCLKFEAKGIELTFKSTENADINEKIQKLLEFYQSNYYLHEEEKSVHDESMTFNINIGERSEFNHKINGNILNLSESNSCQYISLFGRKAIIELKQHENASHFLQITAFDVGTLQILKEVIFKLIWNEISPGKWEIKPMMIDFYEECLSILSDPSIKMKEIMEWYQTMRNKSIELDVKSGD